MAPAEPADLGELPHERPALLLTAGSVDRDANASHGVRDEPPPDAALNPAGFIPQCLLIELMAQTAGLLLPPGCPGAYVAGVRGLELYRAAGAGQRIDVDARLDRRFGRLYRFECRAQASGSLLARGSIILHAR